MYWPYRKSQRNCQGPIINISNIITRLKVKQPMFKEELTPENSKPINSELHPIYDVKYVLFRRVPSNHRINVNFWYNVKTLKILAIQEIRKLMTVCQIVPLTKTPSKQKYAAIVRETIQPILEDTLCSKSYIRIKMLRRVYPVPIIIQHNTEQPNVDLSNSKHFPRLRGKQTRPPVITENTQVYLKRTQKLPGLLHKIKLFSNSRQNKPPHLA